MSAELDRTDVVEGTVESAPSPADGALVARVAAVDSIEDGGFGISRVVLAPGQVLDEEGMLDWQDLVGRNVRVVPVD